MTYTAQRWPNGWWRKSGLRVICIRRRPSAMYARTSGRICFRERKRKRLVVQGREEGIPQTAWRTDCLGSRRIHVGVDVVLLSKNNKDRETGLTAILPFIMRTALKPGQLFFIMTYLIRCTVNCPVEACRVFAACSGPAGDAALPHNGTHRSRQASL